MEPVLQFFEGVDPPMQLPPEPLAILPSLQLPPPEALGLVPLAQLPEPLTSSPRGTTTGVS